MVYTYLHVESKLIGGRGVQLTRYKLIK